MRASLPALVAALACFPALALQGCASSPEKSDPLYVKAIKLPVAQVEHTEGAVYVKDSEAFLYGSARARRVGDLLTVHVVENTDATDLTASSTNRSSRNGGNLIFGAFGHKATGKAGMAGEQRFSGAGNTHQNNRIRGDITVMVTSVLPNGNLVVRGYKTITLRDGVEKIGISGMVRETDIRSSDNSVTSSQIADVHIVYMGEGDMDRSSSKSWLQTILNSRFWPF